MLANIRQGELHISDGDYDLDLRHNRQTGELTIIIGQTRGSGIDFVTDFDIVAGWIEKQKGAG